MNYPTIAAIRTNPYDTTNRARIAVELGLTDDAALLTALAAVEQRFIDELQDTSMPRRALTWLRRAGAEADLADRWKAVETDDVRRALMRHFNVGGNHAQA